MAKPLFLDRDGVINRERHDQWNDCAEVLELFPWTVDCLVALIKGGFDIYVVSNQHAVGDGLFTMADLDAMSAKIQHSIAPHGAQIRKFYYAVGPSSQPDPMRKPNPGMLQKAAAEFGFDPSGVFMVGDQPTDIECAHRAGARPILLQSGLSAVGAERHWEFQPEFIFPSLLEATEFILGENAPCC